MDNKRPTVSDVIQEQNTLESANPVVDNGLVSQYAAQNGVYSTESLEVNDGSGTVAPKFESDYYNTSPRLNFSKRKALIVSVVITFLVGILSLNSLMFLIRKSDSGQKTQQIGNQQDVSLKDIDNSKLPPELQGANESLIVSGDLISRGSIKIVNNGVVTTLSGSNATTNQTVTLPQASGTFCLDSNNCNYASAAQLAGLQASLNQLVIPAAGVNSVNDQKGSVTVQGSLNQISVNTNGGVVTLSTPQNLDSNANVQFGNLTLSAGGQIIANGRTFQLPNSGAASQIICTTTVGCGGGGGGSGDISQGGNSFATPIIIGTNDVQNLQLETSGTTRLTIDTSGNATFSGDVSAVNFSGDGSGLISLNATNISSGTLADGRLSVNVSLLGQTIDSSEIVNGTITGTDIASNTVTNGNLVNSSLTVTAGTGLSGGGSVALGASTNLAVVYGSAANTAVQGNTAITITAGTGLSGGGSITLGAGGSSTLNVTYGSSANTAVQGNTQLTCGSGTGNLSGGGNVITLGSGGTCNNLTITNSPVFSGTLAVQGATATIGADSQQGSVVLYDGGSGIASHSGTVQVIGSLAQNTTYILPDPGGASANICLSTGNCAGAGGGVTTPGGVSGNIAKFTGSGTIDDSTLSESGTTVTATGNLVIQGANSLALGTSSSLDGSVTFRTAAGNNTVSLQAPSANPSSNLVFKLPSAYGSNGDCLISDGAGGMTFTACPGGGGGGVTSIDGETGVVIISNATGNGSGTITIDDATTAAKGIASFSSTNFGVIGGAVSIKTGGVGSTEIADGTVTGTDIASSTVANSNLVNSGVTVSPGTNLTGGGAVALGGTITLNVTNSPSFSGTLGVTGASNLDGGATIRGVTVNTAAATEDQIIIAIAAVGSNRFNGTITNADLTANQTYTLPNASGTVCLSTGNCAGAGSGVTATTPGSANRLAVFTAGQDITSSWLIQNGSDLELDNTRNFELLGGNISANGTVTGTQLISTVSTGTAPLTVASVTLVSNFNADLLDGQTGSFYQDATNLTAGTVASARLSGSYTGITGVGTITAGTWNGTAIADAFLQDNITISNLGTVDWTALSNYPAACAAGSAVSTIGDTLTCTAFATGTTASYIQNQSGSDQSADFRISGTGRANTSLQTPLLDTATATALNIGTTNATVINLNKNVVVASQQTIRFVGGTTGQRPASPAAGTLYFDATTNQLVQWNGSKWVGDHSTATKIVAASNSLQTVKDAADYVADGTSDQVEINAALAAAPGGTVYLAEGTYTIDGTILVPNQTTLAGSNKNATVLRLSIGSGSDNLIENSDTTNGSGITIHDLWFDNIGATGGTQNGIYLRGMQAGNTNSHLYNLVSSWTFGTAVIVEDGTLYRFTDNAILGAMAVRGVNGSAYIYSFTDNVVTTGNLTLTGGASAGSNAEIEKLSHNVTDSLILTGATGYARVGAATSNTIYNDVTLDATNGTALMSNFTGNHIVDDVTLTSGAATAASITTFSSNTISGDMLLNGSTVASTVTTLTGNYISGNLSLSGGTVSSAASNSLSSNLSLSGATGASTIVTFSSNWVAGTTTVTSGAADAAIYTFTGNTATGAITVNGSGGSDAFILNMTGNTFTSVALNTITTEPMTISGNIFYASSANVLALTNADKVSIISNKFYNFGGATNALNINNTSDNTYLADNTLGGLAIIDNSSTTIYASQVNAAGNLLLQPTGTIELLKNTNVTGTLNITGDVDTNGSLTVGNANQFVISNLGVVTSGTWQGTAVTDTYVADTLTVNSSSMVDWQALNNYPAACAAGNAVSTLGDTPTCTAFATGTTASYIQNQFAVDQTADFRISGSGAVAGNLGIGTIPSYKLHVVTTSVANSGINSNSYINLTVSPSSAPGAATVFRGIYNQIDTSSANVNANTTFFGTQSVAHNNGAGNLGFGVGVAGLVANNSSGSIAIALGIQGVVSNHGAGNIALGAALAASSPSVTAGSITNQYGLYLDTQDVSGVGTGYGIYQAGTNDLNILNGATTLANNLTLSASGAPANAPADQGRFYYDATSDTFKLSLNGGGYNDVCTTVTCASGTAASYIQNQFASAQTTADFWVSGSGRLDGNLQIGNGTPTVSLNGEDAYIEGTLEVDSSSRFDGDVTVISNFTTRTGNVAFQRNTTDYTATGTQDDINFGVGELFRITSASVLTINGIAGGTDGRSMTLMNASANSVTIANSASGTAANHVVTGTGGVLTVPAGSSVQLRYDSSASLWRVVGGSAVAGGAANQQLSNLSGTIAVNADLTPNGDNTRDLGSSSFSWKSLYADTSVLTPRVDTATAGVLTVGDANASSINIGKTGSNIATTISGTTIIKTTSGNDSATAFQVQNGAGNTIFGVDTAAGQALLGKASTITGKMVVYNSTNANTITIQSGTTSAGYTLTLPTALGSSGHCLKDTNGSGALGFSACTSGGSTRKITLVPEYPGGVISADGSNNSGNLTSDFDGTNVHNYYNWTSTQGSLNDYDVIVRTPLPSEYASGFGTFKIWAYGGSTSTSNNNIQVTVKDASGTACASSVSVLPGTASLWVEQSVTISGCTFAANDLIVISIKLSSLSSNAVRIGEISYQYTN